MLTLETPIATDPPASVRRIIELTAALYEVTPEMIRGRRRQSHVALPRQVAMYLTRKRTRYSLGDIGEFFGGKHHTTILHAVQSVPVRMASDHDVKAQVEYLDRHLCDIGIGAAQLAKAFAAVA